MQADEVCIGSFFPLFFSGFSTGCLEWTEVSFSLDEFDHNEACLCFFLCPSEQAGPSSLLEETVEFEFCSSVFVFFPTGFSTGSSGEKDVSTSLEESGKCKMCVFPPPVFCLGVFTGSLEWAYVSSSSAKPSV